MSTLLGFIDGFDDNTDLSVLWKTVNPTGGAPTIDAAHARYPSLGINAPSNGMLIPAGTEATRPVAGGSVTYSVHVAFKISSLTFQTDFFALQHGAAVLVNLCVDPNGALFFTHGGGSQIGAKTANGTIVINKWYSAVVQVTADPSAGVANLILENVTLLTQSGLNTNVGGGSSVVDTFAIIASSADITWDDMYCVGGIVSILPMRVISKVPNAPGSFSQWAPNGAATNAACVNEVPPDDDASFTGAGANGLLDSYSMPSVLSSFSIPPPCVVARARCRVDDATTHGIKLGGRNGGVNFLGATQTSNTAVYLGGVGGYFPGDQVIDVDPATGVAFTVAGADTLEFLKERVS